MKCSFGCVALSAVNKNSFNKYNNKYKYILSFFENVYISLLYERYELLLLNKYAAKRKSIAGVLFKRIHNRIRSAER